MTHWSINWLIDWLINWLLYLLIDSVIDWLIDWLIDCLGAGPWRSVGEAGRLGVRRPGAPDRGRLAVGLRPQDEEVRVHTQGVRKVGICTYPGCLYIVRCVRTVLPYVHCMFVSFNVHCTLYVYCSFLFKLYLTNYLSLFHCSFSSSSFMKQHSSIFFLDFHPFFFGFLSFHL